MTTKLCKYFSVNVRDYEKAIDFYTDTMGWDLIDYTPKESKFKKNGHHLRLTNSDKNAGVVYLEYEVTDIAAAKIEFKQQHCEIIKTNSPTSLIYSDPYGMQFHVYEKEP